ncbi:MAG: histidine phosphatase family protein [Chloroflexi bacterium]|nr:histidine phosphatase family protein [Chloroflexota bacterium]
MNQFILIRHGETIWNVAKRFQGQSDIELSDRGRWQAQRTGEHLAGEHIDVVYASDLCRCVDTARLIMQGRDVEIITRQGLRESNFGEWEGLTAQQIEAHTPGALDAMRGDVVGFHPPGGETWWEMSERVRRAFAEIKSENSNKTILVVAHINPVRVMIGDVLGVSAKINFRLSIKNCSVNRIATNARGDSLTAYNDICHLEGWHES